MVDGQKASLVEVAPGGGGRDKLIGCSGVCQEPRGLWSVLCAWAGCGFIVFLGLSLLPVSLLNSVACSLTLSHAAKSANGDEA